ncbi:MAG TPA: hypothetical protein VMZ30_04490 [Pyrinomonadaceae bacterium]|nr:hypothetical protein [Pyrinomonadaceae bacterium]
MGVSTGERNAGLNWIRSRAVAIAVYFLATIITDAYFMGDTPGYVYSILTYEHGGTFGWDNPFWEFGHLFWRPLGYLFFHLFRPITKIFVGEDERLQVTLVLMWLSWLSGLGCVLLLRSLTAHFITKQWVCNLIVVAFIAANAFLNYAQTGCTYAAGMMLFLLGMLLLAQSSDDEAKATKVRLVGAAASLAGAVCIWFPYALVIPAALAIPVLIHGKSQHTYRITWQSALAVSFFLALAYGSVLVHLRIFRLNDFKTWMAAASHGYNQTGVLRMLFGLARSFINMGQDGILFKRYLLHDPYNPVSLNNLFRASLWKFGFFYLTVAAVLLTALRTRMGRRTLFLLALAAAPVFVFALFIFEGGMPERYLPLFPFFFLTLGVTLNEERLRLLKYVTIAFVAVLVISNVSVMSKWALQREQEAISRRTAELQPRLTSNSLVVTVHLQDELVDFYNNFPFHPLNRHGTLQVYSVLVIGTPQVVTWKENFAAKVAQAWSAGGDVWISKRLVQPRPRPEWNWVEGDDRRISWAPLAPFFKQFETGDNVGGDDGFLLILRTPANEQNIYRLSSQTTSRN